MDDAGHGRPRRPMDAGLRSAPPRRLPGARRTRWTTGRTLTAVGLALAGVLAAQAVADRRARGPGPLPRRRPTGLAEARRTAGLHAAEGAAKLAGSVLLDSAMEHFRGNYGNPAMYVGPSVAATTVAAALGGRRQPGPRVPERAASRRAAFGVAAVTGAIGLGFHLYNISKRPGGLSRMNNLFYAAPIGAPGALMVAGLYGAAGEALNRPPSLPPETEGRLLGAFTGFNLLAITAEVWLLHFRGAFHNPAMYVPVTVPPAAGLALLAAAARPGLRLLALARAGCWMTIAIGAAGVGFHALGVHRNHGGWRNWRQTMIQGPPLFAPPSFIGLAHAGIGAVELIGKART